MKKEWKVTTVTLGSAIIGGAITLILGFYIGLNWNSVWKQFSPYLGFKSNTTQTVSLDFSEVNDIYRQVKSSYDGELDDSALIEGAKKGMVAALGDTYSEYMTADEANTFNNYLDGEVGAGIGVAVAKREDYVKVIRTVPDNPARRAGVLAGDIIYAIDGKEVWNKSADEIATLLRGEAGSKIKLTVVRDKKSIDFDLVREEINNVSADYRMDGDTAIISVYRFSKDTGTNVQSIAKEALSKGAKSVVLDLRNNGGGYVTAAKDLLSLWINGDKVLISKSINSADATTYASRNQDILKDTPTVVLINGSTASASEIVAAALKDYGKATIVGEKSFGKGVMQTVLTQSDGSLLKVTTNHWYSPKDTAINKTGVTPDVEVGMTYDQINKGEDPQLDKALEIL